MIIINPREKAAEAFQEIMGGGYSNIVLKNILKRNGAMSQKDKAFVTEITKGTLRNIYYIDYVVNKISTLNIEKMKPWISSVIRISVYQILFMDKLPFWAICDEAVKLVKKRNMGSLSFFVNGVLRNIIKNLDNIELPCEEEYPAEYISIKYSHPIWLVNMWLHEYDYTFVKSLCSKNNESVDMTICSNTLKIEPQNLKKSLVEKGINVKDGIYCKDAFHLSKTSDISKLYEFKNGYFHIQDESSMICIDILEPMEGEKILDICAAPGGKSILCAEKMKNKGTIVSRDIYDHKIELINESVKRLGIEIIETEVKDASMHNEEGGMEFDRVIADVPCSGFGLLRKKPDIKITKNGNHIDELIKIQRSILKAAASYVKRGGVLIYSTCTICKKENIKNVEWFLKDSDFELCSISSLLPENVICDTAEKGYIQFFPNVHDTDGFFVAKMVRRADTL